MEHTKYNAVELEDIVQTLCFEAFSKEKTIWSFWINKNDRWANSLPLVNNIYWERQKYIFEKEMEEKGYSLITIGETLPFWKAVAIILIHGYGVEIPCYGPYEHSNSFIDAYCKRIGEITLDKIISVALDWEQNKNLQWLYLREGFRLDNVAERFLLEVITKK
jgi:hypothetical protein